MAPPWAPPFADQRVYAAFDSVQSVASSENAQTVFGRVKRLSKRLLIADQPWEPRIDNGYPNVHYDPAGRPPYKLWYDCCISVASRSVCTGKDTKATLYAESHDGLEWHKPQLGLVDFHNSTANNIVMSGTHGLGIFYDSNEVDASRRFKAFGRFQRARSQSLTIAAAHIRVLTNSTNAVGKLTRGIPSLGLRVGDIVHAHPHPPDRRQTTAPARAHSPSTTAGNPLHIVVEQPEQGGLASSPDGLRWSTWRKLEVTGQCHNPQDYDCPPSSIRFQHHAWGAILPWGHNLHPHPHPHPHPRPHPHISHLTSHLSPSPSP